MISFQLSQEQEDMQKAAREFTEKEIVPVAKDYDVSSEIPWPVIKKAFEVGLWNIVVPEKYNGQGIESHLSEAIIFEELAFGCLGIFGAFGGTSLALTPLLLAGTEEQKQTFLSWFCQEPRLAAFALTEPGAGSDVGAITTTAKKVGDEYVLNGTKCFITHGGIASLNVVFASVDRGRGIKGITAFIVPGNHPGLHWGKKEDKMGDRASHIGEIILEDVNIPAKNRLGQEGDGFKIAMGTLDRTRPAIGAAAVGLARRAYEESVKYAKQREQFGKPIASNQIIQLMLSEMFMMIESARCLVWRAAWLIDQGKLSPSASAAAKCVASDCAMKVAVDAVQVFGGYGYMKDYPVEKLMRDAKITQIYEGTNQVLRLIIAREITQ